MEGVAIDTRFVKSANRLGDNKTIEALREIKKEEVAVHLEKIIWPSDRLANITC